MTIIIKKADTKEQIEKKLSRLYASRRSRKPKGFDAQKYLGKNIFGGIDGLVFQKQVRNEWS
jgi:hypothetical protein